MCRIAILLTLSLALLLVQQADHAQVFGQEIASELEDLPRGRSLSYRFEDASLADIERYLGYFGVDIPIELRGDLSGWVWGQNQGSFFSLADYIAEAKITSPIVLVEGFIVYNLDIRIGYANGVWFFRNIAGDLVPSVDSTAQDVYLHFTGNGLLPSAASADVKLQLELSEILLPQFLAQLNQNAIGLSGGGTATLRATVPRNQLNNLGAWSGEGRLVLNRIEHFAIQPFDLDAQFSLEERVLTLRQSQLQTNTGYEINFTGDIALDEAGTFQFRLPRQLLALDKIVSAETLATFPPLAINNATLAIDGNGTVSPLQWHFETLGNIERIAYDHIELSDVSINGPISSSDIGPLELTTDIASGTMQGTYAAEDYAADQLNTSIDTTWTNVDVTKLLPTATEKYTAPVQFTGTSKLTWPGFTPEHPRELKGAIAGTITSELFGDELPMIELDAAHVQATQFSFNVKAGQDTTYIISNGLLDWQDWNRGTYHADTDFSRFIVDLRNTAIAGQLPPQLTPEIRTTGQASVDGSFDGIDQLDFDLSYAVVEYDDDLVGIRNTKGSLSTMRLQIEQFEAFYNNRIAQGKFIWQLASVGVHNAELKLFDWPLEELLEIVGGPIPLSDVQGQISADVKVSKDAVTPWKDDWQVTGTIAAQQLVVQQMPVGNLVAAFSSNQDRLRADIQGSAFQGDINGIIQLDYRPENQDYPILGKIELNQASIDELITLYQGADANAVFGGQASGRIEFGLDSSNNLRGNIVTDISDLEYLGESLSQSANISGTFDNERLAIQRFRTRFGSGEITGNAILSMYPYFAVDGLLNLERVDLQKLIAIFDVTSASSFDGIVTGRLTPRVRGNELSWRGNARAKSLRIFDIPIDDAQSQISGQYRFVDSFVAVDFNRISGAALGGRLRGDYAIGHDRCMRMDGQFSIDDGNTAEFEKFIGTQEYFGRGRFDASIKLGSRCYSSINDLNGTLSMDFGPTDAQSVPLMNPIAQAVPSLALPQAQFDVGNLDATIANGVLRVHNALLYSPQLWIAAQGNVGLANGILDIDATLYTGSTANIQIANAVVQNLALVPDPTVQTITAIAQVLSNRSIFLKINGTGNAPVVRLQTGRTIGRYVVQSLARQFTRGLVFSGATGASTANE